MVGSLVGPLRQRIVDDLYSRASALWIVDEGAIRGPSRAMSAAMPRMAIAYVLRERLGWTIVEIAVAIGRDHSTVSNAYHKVSEWITSDPDLAEMVYMLAEALPIQPLAIASGSTLDTLARGVEQIGAAMLVTMDARERELRAYAALIVEQRKTVRDLMRMAQALSSSAAAVRRTEVA